MDYHLVLASYTEQPVELRMHSVARGIVAVQPPSLALSDEANVGHLRCL